MYDKCIILESINSYNDSIDFIDKNSKSSYNPINSDIFYNNNEMPDLNIAYSDRYWIIDIKTVEDLQKYTESNLSNFQNHKTIDWVQILDMISMWVKIPNEIKYHIEEELWKKITSFSAVKTSVWVPKHKHSWDGDIYFGWDSGISVNVWNKEGNKHTKSLENNFITTFPWELHSVQQVNGEPKVFFSIKFE